MKTMHTLQLDLASVNSGCEVGKKAAVTEVIFEQLPALKRNKRKNTCMTAGSESLAAEISGDFRYFYSLFEFAGECF